MSQISGDNALFPQNTNIILNSDDTHYYRASRALVDLVWGCINQLEAALAQGQSVSLVMRRSAVRFRQAAPIFEPVKTTKITQFLAVAVNISDWLVEFIIF